MSELDSSLKGRCILAAEDNEVNQIVLEYTLSEQDLPFHIASNGLEAVEAYQALDPLVILMDVSMPVMDGLEAIAKIRELEQASGTFTPIIVLTAHAMSGDKERILAAGADYYLTKPLNPEVLLSKISEVTSLRETAAA